MEEPDEQETSDHIGENADGQEPIGCAGKDLGAEVGEEQEGRAEKCGGENQRCVTCADKRAPEMGSDEADKADGAGDGDGSGGQEA